MNTIELKEALKTILKAIPSKPSISALNCAMVKDGYITAFDLNTAISVKIELDGTFLIPDKAISLINSISDDELFIEEKDESVTIMFGKSKSKFKTVPFSEYPLLPEISLSDEIIIDIDELNKGISKVAYAVSTSDTKPIHKDIKVSNGEFVAVDGIRLALYKSECNIDTVLPNAIVEPLKRLCGKGSVYITPNHITIETDETRITARRQIGEFLDHAKIVPNRDNFFKVDRQKIVEIAKQLNALQDPKMKTPCKISIKDGKMEFSLNSALSSYSSEIEVSADDCIVGVNVLYLLSALQSFSENEIKISIGKEVEPILMKSGNQTALILPVRLKNEM